MWLVICILLFGWMLMAIVIENYNDDFGKVFLTTVIFLICNFGIILCCLFNTDVITATIENYEKGKIEKHEKIIIEGTDTVRVVKYKYK